MPDGAKKMGELHFTLRFIYTKGSGDKIYQYTQRMLPNPTYTNPMSMYQIDSLRNQVVRHIAMRLARVEPPLRREVVESMLSGRVPVWSIWRAKANFQRMMKCLKFFKTTLIWLDDLCQWKNSTTTIVMFAVFSVFVYYSEIVIPSFFAFLFFKALRNYFKRPRDILCLEANLSQVEYVNTLDWQEELDMFPSSTPFEDFRLRCDRLRAIGYRIEETVGDLATQLERFHAIFSWRDRRATLIFTLFCLVAWIVFYLVPFRFFFSFLAPT
ncbi:FT-interacting protein 3-like [Populus alba x Populus x berolinensis]|uniref:FT-interacting protein 3-like n=1 Tax=Populus alba x Populus x berolinensis TaxID=444605 RepID=A0AAD6L739_9ROSI|nr:FT-interacting protein 3-like [Populus alba x Populus x berolinensis]